VAPSLMSKRAGERVNTDRRVFPPMVGPMTPNAGLQPPRAESNNARFHYTRLTRGKRCGVGWKDLFDSALR
jgi:hypothetical protein